MGVTKKLLPYGKGACHGIREPAQDGPATIEGLVGQDDATQRTSGVSPDKGASCPPVTECPGRHEVSEHRSERRLQLPSEPPRIVALDFEWDRHERIDLIGRHLPDCVWAQNLPVSGKTPIQEQVQKLDEVCLSRHHPSPGRS